MMRIYYDDQTGEILYTLKLDEDQPWPAGSYVEKPDTFAAGALAGWTYDGNLGDLVQSDIAPEKAQSSAAVDQIVSDARLLFITDITGQQMIYLRKEQEANDFLNTPELLRDVNDYPFIKGEAEALNETPENVATTFKARADAWLAIGVALEKVRLARKTGITAATTVAEIETEVAGTTADVAAIIAAAGAP